MNQPHLPTRRLMRHGALAIGTVLVAAATVATGVAVSASPAAAAPSGIDVTTVEPSLTGAGITTESDPERYHQISEPTGNGNGPANNKLVVMLGGSNVGGLGYTDFTAHAAGLGFSAVNLSYPNRGTIGAACQATDAEELCFENARGEIVFGAGVLDPGGQSYSSDKVSVDAANSIVGRLIALIDYRSVTDPSWNRFLVPDQSSPYTSAHHGPVRLKYDRLILAGHSQGGGHAAFLAMRTPVQRVLMLGSPDDTTQTGTAPWISAPSATALDRFWGLRHESEGQYGQHIEQVWAQLGGAGVGAGDDTSEVYVGDGSGDPASSHRLVLQGDQGSALANHMTTAYDGGYLPGVPLAWTYLLTAK